MFITGASTGIGRSLALTLACKHYLVFAGVRKSEDAASVVDTAALRGCGGNIVPVFVVRCGCRLHAMSFVCLCVIEADLFVVR